MIDNIHRLLQRQISKNLSPTLLQNKEVQHFLENVNDAYISYEKDIKQIELILEINNKESFRELNNIKLALDLTASVFIINTKGKLQFVNENFCNTLHYTKEEIINKNVFKLIKKKELFFEYKKLFLTQIYKGEVWKGEAAILDKFNKTLHHNISIIPILNNDNEISQFLFICFDITKEKENKLELKKLSLIANESVNTILILDENLGVEWANKAFEKNTQFTFDEIKGKKPSTFLFGEKTDKKTHELILQKIEEKVPFIVDIVNYKKDKTPYWSSLQIQPFYDDHNKTTKYFSIQQDLSEEKKAKELLKHNEEKYKGIIKNINLGLLEVDLNDIVLFANKSFLQMSGYTEEELLGKEARTILMNEKNQKIVLEKAKVREKNISDAYELQVKNKKGEIRSWLVSGAPNYDENGKQIGSIGIHLDITTQKENEHNLLLFRSLLDNSGDSVQITDEDGNFFYMNEEGLNRLGIDQRELPKLNIKNFDKIFKQHGTWGDYIQELKNTKEGVLKEGVNISKHDIKFPVEVKSNYIDNNGKGYVVAFSRDITNRKLEEKKQLELLEKFRKVNQELADFAYIVSHDLKAPLRAIGSLAGWLKDDYANKLDDEGKNILNLLEQRTQRMHMLIEGVLNYSKIGQTEENISEQNTIEIINNLIDLLSPPDNIKFEIEKDLPNVLFEDIKFGQIFQNLISNAIKFMDKKEGFIKIGFENSTNDIIFFVADNGPGIEEVHQQKIFQIFQTLNSRDDFESTGIGLSIVKKIVESNGGKIWLTSELKKGSTFYFSVPKTRIN